MLYAGTGNTDSGAQIWRSGSGAPGNWTQVAPDETGTENIYQVTGLAVFKGSLYAASETMLENPSPAQLWRSTNGSNWVTVIADGFGDASNTQTLRFAEFDGYLYLGTLNSVSGAQLWRTPDGTTWEQVISDGFGDLNNLKVDMLSVFAGKLYAGVANGEAGLEMWRSNDGVNWEQVNPDGFGDSNNVATMWNNAAEKAQGFLYLGTWNSANGGEIWRYDLQEKSYYMPLVGALSNADRPGPEPVGSGPGSTLSEVIKPAKKKLTIRIGSTIDRTMGCCYFLYRCILWASIRDIKERPPHENLTHDPFFTYWFVFHISSRRLQARLCEPACLSYSGSGDNIPHPLDPLSCCHTIASTYECAGPARPA